MYVGRVCAGLTCFCANPLRMHRVKCRRDGIGRELNAVTFPWSLLSGLVHISRSFPVRVYACVSVLCLCVCVCRHQVCGSGSSPGLSPPCLCVNAFQSGQSGRSMRPPACVAHAAACVCCSSAKLRPWRVRVAGGTGSAGGGGGGVTAGFGASHTLQAVPALLTSVQAAHVHWLSLNCTRGGRERTHGWC